jgi:hypothetical protein
MVLVYAISFGFPIRLIGQRHEMYRQDLPTPVCSLPSQHEKSTALIQCTPFDRRSFKSYYKFRRYEQEKSGEANSV